MEGARPPLIPVLVDAAGRSGTTALMQLLASSPAVVTEREHPYESRYLTYLYSWSRMLDGCPEAAERWERRKMMPGPVDEIGGLPWRDLLADPAGFSSKCFLAAWHHFSEEALPEGTHYIEKVPRWISEAVPSVLPETRVIHLVRDPRDVWLSIASFNRKRGFLSFGREEAQDDEEFFGEFIASQKLRLEPLVDRTFGERDCLLCYEEMVSDPDRTALRLEAWLGLQLDPRALGAGGGGHVTSTSVTASVGRWRKGLPREWKRRFEVELGAVIRALGYSL